MPTPIKYLGGRVEADYRVVLSWDFEAKLSDLPSEGIQVEPEELGSVPLRGDWSLSVLIKAGHLSLLFGHGDLAYAALGQRVTVSCQFAYFADGALRAIETVTWPANTPQPGRDSDNMTYGPGTYSPSASELSEQGMLPHAAQSSIQRYRFSITLTQEAEEHAAHSRYGPMADLVRALRLARLSHAPLMDVRLLFKHADDIDLELWTTADVLEKASNYYKSLFASGAAETVTHRTSKHQGGPSGASEQKSLARAAGPDPSVDWQDSDDETDAFLVERDWMTCTTSKQDAADFDYQQIDVRETAYSTMCAVLLYLQTGHINFASICSSHALSHNELVTERTAALVEALDEHPTLPPPVSPKSVYRLAHLLERDELQKMVLESLSSCLTISCAARELFSPVSVAYDKLRHAVLEFVVKNWKEVKATEAWQAVRAEIASGQLEGGA